MRRSFLVHMPIFGKSLGCGSIVRNIQFASSFSTVTRVKEMKTRNYLDKWLGDDINISPNAVTNSTTINNQFNDIECKKPSRSASMKPHSSRLTTTTTSLPFPIISLSYNSSMDIDEYIDSLDKLRDNGAFFLDMSVVEIETEISFKLFISNLKAHGILASKLGLVNCSTEQLQMIENSKACPVPCLCSDLTVILPSNAQQNHSDEVLTETSASTQTPRSAPIVPQVPSSYTYFGAVRSGQQIYSPGVNNLIILGNVNIGGEILCDGDIQIYGKLLGRVMCGLKGSSSSTIFCRHFEATLIGINDAYIVIEDYVEQLRPVIGKPVFVSLHNKYTNNMTTDCGKSLGFRSNNDSTASSMLIEPTVKLYFDKNDKSSYIAFTILP